MKTMAIVWLAMVVVCLCTVANAQIGITFGNEYGFGIAAQAGSRAVFIEAGAGLAPVIHFAAVDKIGSEGYVVASEETYLKIYFPFSTGARLCAHISGEEGENTWEFKIGADYNTLLKAGFGAGVRYTIFREKRRYALSAGMMFYPDADKELLEKLNEDEGPGLVPSSDSIEEIERFRPYISAIVFFSP